MRTMSITIEERLYDRLKRTIPQRQVSKFVSHAIEERLEEEKNALYQAYLEAARDSKREAAIKEWDAIDGDS